MKVSKIRVKNKNTDYSILIGSGAINLLGKQIKKLIVITRGEKGSIAINGNDVYECDSKKNLKIVDLTGAGDLFAAGFLHGYINNLSTKESLEKQLSDINERIQRSKRKINIIPKNPNLFEKSSSGLCLLNAYISNVQNETIPSMPK